MTSAELFRGGRLNEAVQALGAELRNDPTDAKRRTFLFELLCFAGEYDRAGKQLDVLAQANKNADMGALLYRAALHAERERQDFFNRKDYLGASPVTEKPITGTLNGQPFQSIEDADPRIRGRLEVFAAGSYLWLPLEHVASIKIQPPKRLRDLLWIPAIILTGPTFKGTELGEVLVPALSPFSWRHSDDAVRLGRATHWAEEGEETVPYGQKTLLVDGEDFPLLEVRELYFNVAESAATTE